MLDAAEDPETAAAVLDRELKVYSPELARKPRLTVLNKVDLLTGETEVEREVRGGEPVLKISALTGLGVGDLVADLGERLAKSS